MSGGAVALARRRAALLAWLFVAAYASLIFYFSSRPGSSLPTFALFEHDKILHAMEYGGLGVLLCRALASVGVRPGRGAILALVLALGYGVTDELHQTYTPGRNGNDPGDLAADATGAGLGAALSFAYARRRGRQGAPA